MKAKLKELEGKHYGTEIVIYDDDNTNIGGMNIWLNSNKPADYKPSERELKE